MPIIVLALLLFLLANTDSHGQWYDPKTGFPVQDTDWRKTSGELGAMLITTNDAKGFLDEWRNTPTAHTPKLKTASVVKRGGVISALLFFSGCGSKGGSCNAIVDFKVLSPNGSVYGDLPGNRAWSGQAPPKGILLLSQAHLDIQVEPKDALGVYPVLAILRDPETGKVIHLRQHFEVVP